MKILGALVLVMGLLGVGYAADTAPAAKAATSPSTPACCGDKCKPMANCCKVDAAGKTSCMMGGSCCVKQ